MNSLYGVGGPDQTFCIGELIIPLAQSSPRCWIEPAKTKADVARTIARPHHHRSSAQLEPVWAQVSSSVS